MGLTQLHSGVFCVAASIAAAPVLTVTKDDISTLKAAARDNDKGRARINMHPSNDDPLHEMIIAITRSSYIQPHRHHNKSEAFHLIEGSASVVLFDEIGNILQQIMLDHDTGVPYYRLHAPLYHTLVLHSPMLVIHEITNGPFDPSQTELAPFAPIDNDGAAATAYTEHLRAAISHVGQA